VLPDTTVVGVHCTADTVGTTVITLIVPPVPETAKLVPSGKAPITLLMRIASKLLLLVAEIVAVTTATTPLPIVLVFIPVAMHISDPVPETQLSVLLAAVRIGPTAA